MARGVDLQNVPRRVKEGRGQGVGSFYTPYIQAKDISSRGLTTRTLGWKTGRTHHFLSQLELHYFYTLEWSLAVVDIREQFPLLDGTTIITLPIAEEMGIKHPAAYNLYKKIMLPVVLTTDFLITAVLAETASDFPRTLKYEKDLNDLRTLEKLELERQTWLAQGKELKIVTENEVNKTLATNVQQIHGHRDSHRLGISAETIRVVSDMLTSSVQKNHKSLAQLALDLDENLGLQDGQCLAVAKHLIATRQWTIDMLKPFEPTRPIQLINVSISEDVNEVTG